MTEIVCDSDCEISTQDYALFHFCGTAAVSAPRSVLSVAHAYLREHSGNVVLTHRAVTSLVENAESLPFVASAADFLAGSGQGNPSSSVPVDALLELPVRTDKWLRPLESGLPEATARAVRFILCVHHVQSFWSMHCRNCASCAAFGTDIFALFADLEPADIAEILEDYPFVERYSLAVQPDFHFLLDVFEIVPATTAQKTPLPVNADPFVPSFIKKDKESETVDDLARTLVEGTEQEDLELFDHGIPFPLLEKDGGIVKNGIQFPGRPGDTKLSPPHQKPGEMSHIQRLLDQQKETGVPAAPREWVQAVVDQALMQAQSAIFAGIRARQGELVGALVNKKDKPGKEESGDAEYMPIPWSWCPWLPKESLYRVKMCSYFYHTGHCNKGDACNFSHEMLPGMPPPKPPASVRHGLNSKKSSSGSPKAASKEEPSFGSFSLFDDKYPKSIFHSEN